MVQNPKIEKHTFRAGWNTWAYVIFTMLGLGRLLFNNQGETATIFLGAALIFDPFDRKVKWADRPYYQKAVLLIHLLLFFTVFIFMLSAGK